MASNTIRLSTYGIPEVEIEGLVGLISVLPGMAIVRNTDGAWRPNDTVFAGMSHICVESGYNGLNIDNWYTSGQRLGIIKGRPGDLVYSLLAPGVTCQIGDYMVTSLLNPGYIEVGVAPNDFEILGLAFEAKTGVGANTRIALEI